MTPLTLDRPEVADEAVVSEPFRPQTPADLINIQAKVAACSGHVPFMQFLVSENGAYAGRGALSTHQHLGAGLADLLTTIDRALDGRQGTLTSAQRMWLGQLRTWTQDRIAEYGDTARRFVRHFTALADGSDAARNGVAPEVIRETVAGYVDHLRKHPALGIVLDVARAA